MSLSKGLQGCRRLLGIEGASDAAFGDNTPPDGVWSRIKAEAVRLFGTERRREDKDGDGVSDPDVSSPRRSDGGPSKRRRVSPEVSSAEAALRRSRALAASPPQGSARAAEGLDASTLETVSQGMNGPPSSDSTVAKRSASRGRYLGPRCVADPQAARELRHVRTAQCD